MDPYPAPAPRLRPEPGRYCTSDFWRVSQPSTAEDIFATVCDDNTRGTSNYFGSGLRPTTISIDNNYSGSATGHYVAWHGN